MFAMGKMVIQRLACFLSKIYQHRRQERVVLGRKSQFVELSVVPKIPLVIKVINVIIIVIMKNATVKMYLSVFSGILMSGCLLVGCSGEKSAENETSASSASASEGNGRLVILTWEQYISPDVLEQFSEETGIGIDYQTVENTVEFKARIQSSPGQFDLVIADDVSLKELAVLKLIAPLDRDQLSNFGNLDDRYLGLASDPENAFTIPYVWGSTLIAYRTDLIGDVEPSWESFFDTSHGLPVAMLDEMIDAFACALLAKGHSLNSNDPVELEDAAELLQNFAKNGDMIVEELFTSLDALDEGQVAMAMTFSGDAALYAEGNEMINYVIPKEGAALWLDSFAIGFDARNNGNAHKFIEFMLRPEIAAQNASELWYASPNREALAHLDTEFLEDKAIWPSEAVQKRCDFHATITGEREVILSKGMKYVMDAVRRKRGQTAVTQADSVDATEGN
jgi:spermidine/putrescine transport system substrate-binding protein